MIPMGRLGKPSEISGMVSFLALDRAYPEPNLKPEMSSNTSSRSRARKRPSANMLVNLQPIRCASSASPYLSSDFNIARSQTQPSSLIPHPSSLNRVFAAAADYITGHCFNVDGGIAIGA